MNDVNTGEAILAWKKALGDENVWDSEHALSMARNNVTGLERDISAVIRPASTAEVIASVQVANEFRQPIYPFGRGQNWGLGSRLPVRDGCVLMDLSRMNRIIEINAEGAYAVVEPGVTQRQLYEALVERNLPLIFNVTGSGADSSVLGNALDRGIGYFCSKAGTLSGLEVVLGTGEVLRTGYGHFANCTTTHIYRHGLGPGLDDVFVQSNFGVVTQAGVALFHAPASTEVVVCRKNAKASLAEFVDGLIDLHRCGVLNSVVHIGNRFRAEAAMAPLAAQYLKSKGRNQDSGLMEEVRRFLEAERFSEWTGVGTIMGAPDMVKAGARLARKRLSKVGSTLVLNERRLRCIEGIANVLEFLPWAARKKALLPSIREHFGLCRGMPTSEPVKSCYWSVDVAAPDSDLDIDPDQSVCGMIYFLPMMPLTGEVARHAVDMIDHCFDAAGFSPLVTLNLIDGRFLEAVINVAFRRDRPEEVSNAHALMRRLREEFLGKGWYPYRLGIHEMGEVIKESDPFWQTARKLKSVFDPNHIIAPGRYNLV